MQDGSNAKIWRGELWIDEDGRFYVEDSEGEREHVDEWLAEEMAEQEAPMHREDEKFLGVGKVYVFVGTDDWEQFREQVKGAESLLTSGETELGLDELRRALELSEGLA